MDLNVKQVKVDNWGIYFLQRLKHFFNRTDYCDLTLQFQDNAQLKVHRLVLSACTEYFELLERTCEMYEDCLVMPDDLQADVVVPIVNFMYTGQLEFHIDSLERLYQTSQVMNMPVLTKLLESHRVRAKPPTVNYGSSKRSFTKSSDLFKTPMKAHAASSTSTAKRSYTKAFANASSSASASEVKNELKNGPYVSSTPITLSTATPHKKPKPGEPRPTRYDLPEELDGSIFDDSFTNISYTSEPLMVHPETVKRYPSKKLSSNMFSEPTSSKRSTRVTSVLDIMESKKVLKSNNIFDEDTSADLLDEQTEMFQPVHVKKEKHTVSEHIFDQMMDIPDYAKTEVPGTPPKVTIEAKNANQASNMDHAKIISEVLKKYPHLMKSKRNIKLKILNTPTSPNITKPNILKSKKPSSSMASMGDLSRVKMEQSEFECDVLNSQEAAKLIALGPENVKGPWICLICGTPGRALHFPSYYKFRRHLVEVHKEKPTLNICEHCGLKSGKRNYMLHHLYTKHGIEPPPAYRFPKCNSCNYVALTEALLVKHKNTHIENRTFRCYVCPAMFHSTSELLVHIQATGHKYSSERKTNLQCIYCLKVFLRESNLYAHIKVNHKLLAIQDGIIDDSDDESRHDEIQRQSLVKFEPPSYEDYEGPQTEQYEIMPNGNIELVSKKRANVSPTKQKILNAQYINQAPPKQMKKKPVKKIDTEEFHQEVSISPSTSNNEHEEIVMIDNNEYTVKGNQLVLRKEADHNEQYILSDVAQPEADDPLDSLPPMEFADVNDTADDDTIQEQPAKLIKTTANINQSLIVVSNEEEYKALMNANHSIIFDDTEANKTLTVLSTPHGATLTSTSMDLANTQPPHPDMMVIQEDYPLTVSEAMPADNNIMVVYSHQNKPYQIISSQGLGGQYVQGSAVVTQNFEAISGSTPVVTDHQAVIIGTHQTGSWQRNISTNQQMENAGTELQELSQMTIVEPAEITAVAEDNDSMNELPDDVTLQVVTMEENSQSSANAECTQEATPQQEEQENEGEPAMNIDESGLEPCAEETPEEPIPDEAVEQEHDSQDGADEEKNHEEPMEEQAPDETDSAEIPENAEMAHESTEPENDSMQVAEQEQMQEAMEPAQNTLVDNGAADSEEAPKPVEPFTSEWSEDEYDTNEENVNSQEKDVDDNVVTEQVEETIENIQQEMEKQMTEVDAVDEGGEASADTEENDSQKGLTDDQNDHGQENDEENDHEPSEDTVPPPPEKISSLLNDWDDNDSQEGNEAVDGNEDAASVQNDAINDDTNAHTEVENGSTEAAPIKEKLKSLVSDWDEDE